jgi:hypothetical protein
VVAYPRLADAALNLGECPLHCGARQIKVHGKLRKGCIGGFRSSTGDPCVQSVCLQKILRQRQGAGSRLPHPSVHRTGEVRCLSIHTAIQRPTYLSPDATSLHLGHRGRCSESPQ